MLTFIPRDNITSAGILLRYPVIFPSRTAVSNSKARAREDEIIRLAQRPETILKAIGIYRNTMISEFSLHSQTPWILLTRSHDFRVPLNELDWLIRSIRMMHGYHRQNLHELLLTAHLRLGSERQLHLVISSICADPQPIGADTLAGVLLQLQATLIDRRLACRLWEAQIEIKSFAPSQTCVHLALKAAIHSENMELATITYRFVLQRKWSGIRTGYWIEKIMIYGLSINKMVSAAFDMAIATTNIEQLESEVVAMQTAQKYELLLMGLSKVRCATEAEIAFLYVREKLGMWPTAAMYSSLLGALACDANWNAVEKYLALMEKEDEYIVPEAVWKRILLGVARQGRVDLCDKVLKTMASRGIPYTHVVVTAAIDAYAQLGNLNMVVRWYNVIAKALSAQVELSPTRQNAVHIDGTTTSLGTDDCTNGQVPYPPCTLEQPEGFIAYFIQLNELVWHRSALTSLIDAVGELGDAMLLMQLWKDISHFRLNVVTLRLSPQIYMALARSLAWHSMLNEYANTILSWIRDESNGFSASQQTEAEEFVKQCLENNRNALRRPKFRPKIADFNSELLEEEADLDPTGDVKDFFSSQAPL
ncbi:hypothetical protein H4S08_000252 [Coemansia sp. RSA 1365]|nr:hypothetical protein H4S08_000252 [Coemansia sp. RSA 1365]